MKGIDYSWGRPGGKVIKDAGYHFVCRYLSNNPRKNLCMPEIDDLHSNGLQIVTAWETSELRPLGGFSAGAIDAKRADTLALMLGWPPDKCIYFACDSDFQAPSLPVIEEYFKGIASVLSKSRIGAYGGFNVIKSLLDARLCSYAWQTAAWSSDVWDNRVNIKQFNSSVTINKVVCDLNESCTEDFGQW